MCLTSSLKLATVLCSSWRGGGGVWLDVSISFFGVGDSDVKQSVRLFPSVPPEPHLAASPGPIGTAPGS